MADNTKSSDSKQTAPLTSPGYFVPFVTVTALFLTFGFITTLNMSLVPHLRLIFNVGYKAAMLAESAFFLAYFVFSAPTSKLIETIGYKKTMVVSLFIQVVGCLLFIPAANLVNFPLFLTACFVVGAGVTALQTSAIRMQRFWAPKRARLCGLRWRRHSIRSHTVAPLFAGAFILTDPTKFASPAAIADTVRAPYIAIAGALLVLGIAVAFSSLAPHRPAAIVATSRRCAGQHQRLELSAHGAGCAGYFSVRGRGGWPGVNRRELLQAARHELLPDRV
ncbi:MAG: MFS transporter [Terracidiphilus sp.]